MENASINVIKLYDKLNDLLSIGNFSINFFAEIISSFDSNIPELKSDGKFTFFIPVDTALQVIFILTVGLSCDFAQNLHRALVDIEVIKSHIVPGKLLFTRPRRKRAESKPSLQYHSSRGSLSLQVMLKLLYSEGESRVESHTVVGSRQHKRGVVRAKIVKGDIPVSNGVVHLIDRPLVIMAETLAEMVIPESEVEQETLGLHLIIFTFNSLICLFS